MIAAPVPADEQDRLAELRSLRLLDTVPEERFDRITRAAQRRFDVPIALVSLVDEDRQWFKSRQGLETAETSREVSFCAHAILGDDLLQVSDATTDPRFADNPLVLGAPGIRFYTGCPIKGPGGHRLGTLCIIDTKPRDLSPRFAAFLGDLATMVEHEIAAPSADPLDRSMHPVSPVLPEFKVETIDCPTCGEPNSVLISIRYRDGVATGPPRRISACRECASTREQELVDHPRPRTHRDPAMETSGITDAHRLMMLIAGAAVAFVAIILVAVAITR